MFLLDQDIVVNRPVAEVFAFVADPTNEPEWVEGVVALDRLEGDGGVGSVFEESQSFLFGIVQKNSFAIDALTPDAEMVLGSRAGPATFEIHWTTEAVDGGTRVRVKGEVQPVWYLRPLQFLLSGQVNGTFERSLVRLKDVLEQR